MGMTDREKVIKGLEYCQDGCGDECPYWTRQLGSTSICRSEMERDALALLKAQEPVKPILQSGGNYVCGNCGMYTVGYMHPLTGESVQTWKYCGKCGKRVKWE